MKFKTIGKIIGSILICQSAGIVGSIFTVSAIETWYTTLNKPWFTPPGWLFAPVWVTLYTLMGISLYLILKKGISDKKTKIGIGLFATQLILNALWTIIFFGLKTPLFALIEIIILWIFILLTIIKFYTISRKASLILLPYLIWVSIATALNYAILILN